MRLRRLVYGSSTPGVLSDEDLADILEVSRRNNAADGITGVLLYAEGNVIQVMEGEPEAVARTFAHIQADTRHRHVVPFLDREVTERMFPDWSMGLIQADRLSGDDRTAVRSLLDAQAPAVGVVGHLLSAFREMHGR